MRPTFQTLLDDIDGPTPAQIVDALTRGWQPNQTCPCLNPLCDGEKACTWPDRAERPKRFCIRRCRQIFDRIRGRLLKEAAALQAVLDRDDLTSAELATVSRHIGRRRWALERYPPSTRGETR